MFLGETMTEIVVLPLSTLAGSALAFYVGGASTERVLGVKSEARWEE
jgi:hypothetical protein